MATVRICDWSKQPLEEGTKTFRLILDSQAFEVSAESYDQLIERLTSSEIPINPVQAAATADALPEDTSRVVTKQDVFRRPPVTREQERAIVEQSVKHPAGSLDVLGSGKARREAEEKLRQSNQRRLDRIKRKAGLGINLNTNDNVQEKDRE